MALLCCSSERQTKPTSLPALPEAKERYVVHLVCPDRTLGLELAYSKRAPFIVTPLNMPAIDTEIRKGDALIGIDNWFFNSRTKLDKVLNEVRMKMQSAQPVVKLILERNNTPPNILQSDEESVDEKLAELPQTKGRIPTPPPTDTPDTLKVSQQQIGDAVSQKKAINEDETKEVEAVTDGRKQTQDGSNGSIVNSNEIKHGQEGPDNQT